MVQRVADKQVALIEVVVVVDKVRALRESARSDVYDELFASMPARGTSIVRAAASRSAGWFTEARSAVCIWSDRAVCP